MTIGEGEVVGLVGESGSGESTIANLVLGLEQADAGRIRFRGRDVREWPEGEEAGYRQAVQAVFQHPFQALDSRKRVGWLVAEPLVIYRRGSSRSRAAQVKEVMADVHFDPSLVDRYPHQLSGGQAQRVNIARVLALEPSLLVCDEPVSVLDVSVQAQILNLSDRIVVMYAGTAVEEGPGGEVSDRPIHPYTQLLVSAASVVTGDRGQRRGTMRETIPSVVRRFVLRCPVAIERCSTEEPSLDALQEGHSSRRWLASDPVLRGAGG